MLKSVVMSSSVKKEKNREHLIFCKDTYLFGCQRSEIVQKHTSLDASKCLSEQ